MGALQGAGLVLDGDEPGPVGLGRLDARGDASLL